MSFDVVDGVLNQLKAAEIRDSISSHMDMRLVEFGRGEAVYEMPLRKELGNAMGVVQGGVATVIADVAMAMAAMSTLSDEEIGNTQVTTVDLYSRFMRPASVGQGVMRADAKVVRSGKSIVWTECDVSANGKVIGKFTATGTKIRFAAEQLVRSASSASINIPTDGQPPAG
jgi:uncharacterized protein (TIGR00369 family)